MLAKIAIFVALLSLATVEGNEGNYYYDEAYGEGEIGYSWTLFKVLLLSWRVSCSSAIRTGQGGTS